MSVIPRAPVTTRGPVGNPGRSPHVEVPTLVTSAKSPLPQSRARSQLLRRGADTAGSVFLPSWVCNACHPVNTDGEEHRPEGECRKRRKDHPQTERAVPRCVHTSPLTAVKTPPYLSLTEPPSCSSWEAERCQTQGADTVAVTCHVPPSSPAGCEDGVSWREDSLSEDVSGE